MEDTLIVDLYIGRDEAAITASAEKYGARLRSLALGITADPETAQECENDTYLQAWNSIPPHEPRTYLYPFLARITRHTALNRCRDARREAHILQLTQEMEQCIPAPDQLHCHLEEQVLKGAINGFLATLTAEKRCIFLRRYFYLDSVADIANRFGLTQSKVKVTLFRTRTQLRAHLIKEGYHL